ncbi:MAG: hypothetical protein HKO92_06500 [Flavobacteriaceae bacterium]|nr:hypothetical protein [Flavobacteriaceae bacterium]
MTGSNYRKYVNYIASLQACKRDIYIKSHGLCVTALLPVDSDSNLKTEINYFGDMCAINRVDKPMFVLPLYNDYYTLLDVIGEDHEDPLPLECETLSVDHWPRDTIFMLPVLIEGVLKDRFWRVLSHEQKHLEVNYQKKIKCVPARDSWLEGVN